MSSATTPAPAAQSTAQTDNTPAQRPLPPAQLFDILPPLDQVLSRLEPSLNVYTIPPTSGDDTQLAYKDASLAAQFLKTRIRKAQVELAKLDDMDRTVAEQKDEIEDLNERIEKQVKVLTNLAALASTMTNVKDET